MRLRNLLGAFGTGLTVAAIASTAFAQQRSFDLASGPAVNTIPEFARQAGLQIIAPADQLKGVATPAVKGAMDARAALKQLISGTGLVIASDAGSVISLKRAPASPQPSAGGSASAEGPPAVLESVTVTATKRETALMKTPVAVSAVSGDGLDRDGIRDVRSLGAAVPSMQVGFSPSDSGVQVTIRGVTSNNFTELGDPAVGIHLDGVYSPRPQAGMNLMHDVDRIEVLRGPQGTLFGRNSTAGAINILPRRPSFSGQTFFMEGELGDYNKRALRLVYNQPVNDVLALRFAFSGEKQDGYIKQVQDRFDLSWPVGGIAADGIPNTDQRWNKSVGKGDYYTATNRWAGRMSAYYKPTDKLSWLVTLERYEDHSPGNIAVQDCDKAPAFAACNHPTLYASVNVPGVMNLSSDSIRSELVYKLMDGIKVEYRTAFTRERRAQAYDGDGGAFASPNDPAFGMAIRTCCGANFGPLVNNSALVSSLGFDPAKVAVFPFEDLQLRTRWSRYDSLVNELQIKSDGDGALKWVAGLFDLREKNAIRFDVDQPWCCGAGIPLAQSFVQPDRRSDSTAVFGQADYKATDKLNFTAGYRYTWDEKSDRGGSNHQTIGYWVNSGLYKLGGDWLESWGFTGPGTYVPNWTGQCQSTCMLPNSGTADPNFLKTVPGTDNSTKASWSRGTWKLGFDYTINDDLFVYGSVATGYKGGGFGDKVDTCNCGNLTAFPYKPETDTNYELAMKARFFNRTLNFIATVFDTEFSNMQRTGYVIVGKDKISGAYIGTNLTTNIAAARIRGVELETDWIPYRGGRITGWVSYNDAAITKYPQASDGMFCFERAWLKVAACPAANANGDRPTSYVGNQLPWTPEFSASVNYEHNWYLGEGLRLSPYVSAHWQSKEYFDDANLNAGPYNSAQKSLITVNASLRLINEKQHWGAELYVYNLTDQLVREWSQPGPDYMKAAFFPPRMIGMKLNKEF